MRAVSVASGIGLAWTPEARTPMPQCRYGVAEGAGEGQSFDDIPRSRRGIRAALEQLPPDLLKRVHVTALSTHARHNFIVRAADTRLASSR